MLAFTMKLFQIIFAIGCVIVGVLGAPGHVSYFKIIELN